MQYQEIENEVKKLIIELFDVPAQDIVATARLYEDLGLDSIDAVDMIVHLQKKNGEKDQT
jgi:Phosphopantetheine attachment site.